MFYDENEINNILNCPMCNFRYEEPKQLPCGQIICNYCVSKLDKEFNCSFCLKNHQIPTESFPTCDLISRLLRTKANEVSRSENVDLLKSNLNDIQELINELSYAIDHGLDNIQEHCLNLRREVQLATETVINQVNEINEQMINQINKYEQERIKEFKDSKQNKDAFIKTIDELKQYYNEWSDYIKNFKVNETKLKNANCLAKELKTKSIWDKKILEIRTFKDKYLEFKNSMKKIDTTILGSLASRKETFRIINFKDLIQDFGFGFKVVPFKKLNYLIGYCSNNGLISFKLINRDQKILKIATINCHPLNFNFITNSKHLIVSYKTASDSNIEVYDENLTQLKKVKSMFFYNNLSATDSNIYCLTGFDSNNLHVYDMNLQLIKSIGQTRYENEPFYFTSNIIKFEVKNGKYFWLNPASINIVDEKTGIIDKTIEIRARNFMFSSKDTIVLNSHDNKRIFTYYLNEEKFSESKFENYAESFFIDSNEAIVCYDSKEFNLTCEY